MAHFGAHIALPLPIATLMSGSPPFSLPCSPSLHRVGKVQPTRAKFELLGGLLVAIFPSLVCCACASAGKKQCKEQGQLQLWLVGQWDLLLIYCIDPYGGPCSFLHPCEGPLVI